MQNLPNSLQVDPQVKTFKEEGKLIYDLWVSNRQELLRLGQNIDWQMTRHHENHLHSQGCNLLPKLNSSQDLWHL